MQPLHNAPRYSGELPVYVGSWQNKDVYTIHARVVVVVGGVRISRKLQDVCDPDRIAGSFWDLVRMALALKGIKP